MATKKEKKAAYGALKGLMDLPGSLDDIWHDVIGPPSEDTKAVLRYVLGEMKEYTDRDAAILYASLLERALEGAIATHFETEVSPSGLFSYSDDGPLSTLAAKISMGYALGVYDEGLRDDLRMIKEIRNTFAHSRIFIEFKTTEIATACELLNVPKPWQIWKRPRERYVICIGLVVNYFRHHEKDRKPLRYKDSQFYRNLYGASP